jgi:hypothetical protein
MYFCVTTIVGVISSDNSSYFSFVSIVYVLKKCARKIFMNIIEYL